MSGKHAVNDKVLCFHGPMLYRARVLEAQNEGDKLKYRVHYEGWNQKWDEFVPEDRVLELNEANLEKQKELEDKAGPKKKRKSGLFRDKDGTGTSSRPSTPSIDEGKYKSSRASTGSDYNVEQRKKRARADPYIEYEQQYLSRAEVKVKIPDDLKPLLVDDWDYVTRQLKLLKVPASSDQTVRAILDGYVNSKSQEEGLTPKQLSLYTETAHGIAAYFEAMLGTQLLYKFERLQYAEFLQSDGRNNSKIVDVYGYVHLLRLFIRLGNMLSYTSLSENNISMILGHISDLLSYMQKNKARFYSSTDYYTAPPEYTRRSFS